MRYIDLQRPMEEKKFRLYIGETGFILKDHRKSRENIEIYKKDLEHAIKVKNRGDIKTYKEAVLGKTFIYPFPPTPNLRAIEERNGKMRPEVEGCADVSTRILVCEDIDEINRLIEEADERDNIKKFRILKHLL